MRKPLLLMIPFVLLIVCGAGWALSNADDVSFGGSAFAVFSAAGGPPDKIRVDENGSPIVSTIQTSFMKRVEGDWAESLSDIGETGDGSTGGCLPAVYFPAGDSNYPFENTDGDLPSGDLPSGDIPSEDIPSGDIVSEDILSEDIVSGDIVSNDTPLEKIREALGCNMGFAGPSAASLLIPLLMLALKSAK